MGDDIRREDETDDQGRYVLSLPDGQEAFLTFSAAGGSMLALDYSYVPPSARGRGVAGRLVAFAVADARSRGQMLIPLCGYVAAEMRRHPEWQDVLVRHYSVPATASA